jgi:hypothetical protein
MAKLYRVVFQLSWALGLLSLLAAVVLRLAPSLLERTGLSPRGALGFAVALFLCAIATREMERT